MDTTMTLDRAAMRSAIEAMTPEFATLVAAILFVIALPIAYWITYSRWRWKFLAEAIVALPIVAGSIP